MLTPKRRFLRLASIISVAVPLSAFYFTVFWVIPSIWRLDVGLITTKNVFLYFFKGLFSLDFGVLIPGIVVHAVIGIVCAFIFGGAYLLYEKESIAKESIERQKEEVEKERKIARVYRELEEMTSKKKTQSVSAKDPMLQNVLSPQQEAL